MEIALPIGIAIIVVTYAGIWFFVLKSKQIIEKIHKLNLKKRRDIERELGL